MYKKSITCKDESLIRKLYDEIDFQLEEGFIYLTGLLLTAIGPFLFIAFLIYKSFSKDKGGFPPVIFPIKGSLKDTDLIKGESDE